MSEPEVIFAYTRADAISDGVLVDLTDQAKQLGFVIPVACTDTLLSEIAPNPQDVPEAIIKLLWTMRVRVERTTDQTDRIEWEHFSDGRAIPVYAVVGPGDRAEPVMTIMLQGED